VKLSTGRIKLHSAMKTLKARWETTQTDWNDAVSREFEENTFVPLEQQVAATLRAIDRLAQAIEQLHAQLGDE